MEKPLRASWEHGFAESEYRRSVAGTSMGWHIACRPRVLAALHKGSPKIVPDSISGDARKI
jgi:hypothetical protein